MIDLSNGNQGSTDETEISVKGWIEKKLERFKEESLALIEERGRIRVADLQF
jgi:hypothetical protein